jgi:ketosteroid isomerase-like protein
LNPPVDELQRLLIEAACLRLVTHYCRSIDVHDHEGVLSVFAPDALWNHPEQGVLRGHEGIRGFLTSPARRNNTALMRHVISNLQVEVIDADRAKGLCYWTAFLALDAGAAGTASARAPFSIGEYQDEFVRNGGEWRIAVRSMRNVFRGA